MTFLSNTYIQGRHQGKSLEGEATLRVQRAGPFSVDKWGGDGGGREVGSDAFLKSVKTLLGDLLEHVIFLFNNRKLLTQENSPHFYFFLNLGGWGTSAPYGTTLLIIGLCLTVNLYLSKHSISYQNMYSNPCEHIDPRLEETLPKRFICNQ